MIEEETTVHILEDEVLAVEMRSWDLGINNNRRRLYHLAWHSPFIDGLVTSHTIKFAH